MNNIKSSIMLAASALVAGCTLVCCEHSCEPAWKGLVEGRLEDSADFETGVWTVSDGVLTASKDSALWFRGDYSHFALVPTSATSASVRLVRKTNESAASVWARDYAIIPT